MTAKIQAWIDSTTNNSVLSFVPGGCYRVDETLVVENRDHVSIDGKGAVLKAVTRGDRTRQQLVLSGGTNLTVRNLTVRGANPGAGAIEGAYHSDLEGQFAFEVSGATNVLLDHVQAYDLYGDFVYIGPSPDRQPSKNVTVTRSIFERSGRQGISITDAENVTIKANTIGGAALSLFDIEPNSASQEARSIRITGNTTGAAGDFWLANKGAHGDIGDIQISGNRMSAATGGLIFVYASSGPYRGPYVITNNHFIASDKTHDEHSRAALFFTRTENVSISGNTVIFPKGISMPAVELHDSHQVQLSHNTFTNAGQKVLASDGTTGLRVG